jgi:hypothetical protein
MQVPEDGLDMPGAGAESSSLIFTRITKREILEKVKFEQLFLEACRSVRSAGDYSEALQLRPFSNDQVIELIGEVLEFDVSSLRNVGPGVGYSAVKLTSFGPRTKSGVYACVEANLTITIGSMNVYPMSVSNFGNFLYALKHGGQAVALATLHRIYSEAA